MIILSWTQWLPSACNLLRVGDAYRRDAFSRGLQRLGYTITEQRERKPGKDDILLIWNRSRAFEEVARFYESRGAIVIVTENGYLPTPDGQKTYALSRRLHNGAGEWVIGDRPRFEWELKPWRSSGDHILVCPQRGVGSPGVCMPANWQAQVVARLKRLTSRPIRVRKHPGPKKSDPWPDLIDCHAVVTWGSGAGIKAIVHGVPVFHELRPWIGRDAAVFGIEDLEAPFLSDRRPMLHRLSWAMWTLPEIESGEAFATLLGR